MFTQYDLSLESLFVTHQKFTFPWNLLLKMKTKKKTDLEANKQLYYSTKY
jgi:hypothetical protein